MNFTPQSRVLLALSAAATAAVTGCNCGDTVMNAISIGLADPECRTYNACALSGDANIWVICPAAEEGSVTCYLAISRDRRTRWSANDGTTTGTCEQVAASLARSPERPTLVLKTTEVLATLLRQPCAPDGLLLTELQRCSADQRLGEIQSSLVSLGWELSEDGVMAWRPAKKEPATASSQ